MMSMEEIWQGVYAAAKAEGETDLEAQREADAVCAMEEWREYMLPFNNGCEHWEVAP